LFGNSISKFFITKSSCKKDDVQWKEFLEDLALLIVKNNLPIQFVENVWLKHLPFPYVQKLIILLKGNSHKIYYQL